MSRRLHPIESLLCCPVCHADLECREGETYRCLGETCARSFPSVDGVPILIHEENSIFLIETFLKQEPTFFKRNGRLRETISRYMPNVSSNLTAGATYEKLRELLQLRDGRQTVLVIGGSILGAGIKDLVETPDIDIIETDAALGPRTQLICDGHDLPLKDTSVDAVIVQAVLEHVVDPVRCVAEIHRVLKPGGLVYSDTPFIQQVHGREFDFTRFTRLGHRRLFRHFDEVCSGMTGGPGTALAWSIRYFLMSFSTSPRYRAAVSGATRLGFFWLKYVDRLLANRPAANDAASAFYFLGSKSDQVLADRELVASYEGGFA